MLMPSVVEDTGAEQVIVVTSHRYGGMFLVHQQACVPRVWGNQRRIAYSASKPTRFTSILWKGRGRQTIDAISDKHHPRYDSFLHHLGEEKLQNFGWDKKKQILIILLRWTRSVVPDVTISGYFIGTMKWLTLELIFLGMTWTSQMSLADMK